MHHLNTSTEATILSAILVVGAAAVLFFSLSQEAQAQTNPTLVKGIANLNRAADRTDEAGESDVATQLRAIAEELGGGDVCPQCG